MTWTLDIPREVPSANDRQVNGRDPIARAIYRRLRNAWATDLTYVARIVGVPLVSGVYPIHRPRRRVTVTRIMGPGQREYDEGNLHGGAKPIVDAMQPSKQVRGRFVAGASLIVDDSPRWIEIVMRQEKGAHPSCRIELEDLP